MPPSSEPDSQELRKAVLQRLATASDAEVRRVYDLLLEWERQRATAIATGHRLTPFDEEAIDESIRRFRDQNPAP